MKKYDGIMVYTSFSSFWTIVLLCLAPVITEDCSPGKWGENCTVCGHCKDGVHCNSKSGECREGCAPGYKTTLLCENECNDGDYGQACLFECIEDCMSCNKVNGSCTLCKGNLQGFHCNETVEVQTKPVSSRTPPVTEKDKNNIFPAALVWPTAIGVACLFSVLLTVIVGLCIKVQRLKSQAIPTIPRPDATGRSHVSDTSLDLRTLADKNQGLNYMSKAHQDSPCNVYEQLYRE